MDCKAQCNIKINPGDDSILCISCAGRYHRQCVNISQNEFVSLSRETRASWVCPTCTNINTRRRGSNLNTPVGKHQLTPTGTHQLPSCELSLNMSLDNSLIEASANCNQTNPPPSCSGDDSDTVTMKKISNLLDQKIQTSVSAMIDEKLQTQLSSFMASFRVALQEDIKKMVRSEIKSSVKELENNFSSTTDFICAEQATMKSQLAEKNKIIKSLEADCAKVQSDISALNSRLLSIETMSRSHNIEIQAVPESKSENLLTLMKNLCNTIGMTLDDGHIVACRRVAKMDTKSVRPRNILVTLASPRLRDSFLSLARRYNKTKAKTPIDMLNCSHLGIADKNSRIFVTEHISPQCKILYSEARRIAKEKNYTFVWVKYGRIFVRKDEQSSPIHIKTLEHLKKVQ